MSLKHPTFREYLVVGIINVAVAIVLGVRGSWTAAYFGVLAVGALGCALRAGPGR